MAVPAKSTPKDAQVMQTILKDMGVTEYEPRVINQMLEFTYSKFGANAYFRINIVLSPNLFCGNLRKGKKWSHPDEVLFPGRCNQFLVKLWTMKLNLLVFWMLHSAGVFHSNKEYVVLFANKRTQVSLFGRSYLCVRMK